GSSSRLERMMIGGLKWINSPIFEHMVSSDGPLLEGTLPYCRAWPTTNWVSNWISFWIPGSVELHFGIDDEGTPTYPSM
ncbi:hypothetical protein HAX54_027258, partial [Datura stramonium]|nr:hypothetical protein [Datura stramonium]